MMIPVMVQQPCKPPGLEVGWADENLTAEQVADLVGVPSGTLIEGKILRRKGVKRWSLVANVEFKPTKSLSDRLHTLRAAEAKVHYQVSITDAKQGNVIAEIFSGDDYQEAFDAACTARSNPELRGLWIKFTTGAAVRWAVIS